MHGMIQRQEQDGGATREPLGPHAYQTSHQQRIGQIANGLLVVFTDEAAVPAAGLRHLDLGNDLVDHARHVSP